MTTISAETPQLALQICGCGRFHMTYGKITLHFEPQEFVKFAGDVFSLFARLKQPGHEAHGPMSTSGDHSLCH